MALYLFFSKKFFSLSMEKSGRVGESERVTHHAPLDCLLFFVYKTLSSQWLSGTQSLKN